MSGRLNELVAAALDEAYQQQAAVRQGLAGGDPRMLALVVTKLEETALWLVRPPDDEVGHGLPAALRGDIGWGV